MIVCLYRRISLTAEPVWFSYSKDPRFITNFREETFHPPKRNYLERNSHSPKKVKYNVYLKGALLHRS